MKKVLGIDIGASSGRAILGTYDNGKITMTELHRFSNDPVTVNGHTYWDILRLFHEIKQAIKIAGDIDSIGIDTWGVDFGLIDKDGNLMGNPYHYRDVRNNDAKKLDVYKQSGIQFMQFNTLYQLQKTDLSNAYKLLLIPDLLANFLTGEMRMEYTNASTTNLLNAHTHQLDESILTKIGVSSDVFPRMIKPGEWYGHLSEEICDELNVKPVPVIAVGTHDTASAIATIPAKTDEEFAYISSGTWSLFGTILDEPLVNDLSEELNFTNELAVDFRIRFLKNVMGLWLLQELRKEAGVDFQTLSAMAQAEQPFKYIVDPDSGEFLGIGNMHKRISVAVKADITIGQAARCIYDSLALKYRYTLEAMQRLTGKKYNKLYMFGGGIKDTFLCQLTANALGIPVITGSDEATALGNIAVQLNIKNVNDVIINSIATRVHQPTDREIWSIELDRYYK